eukprot:TRINITY_DN452_c1_g1_i1.p1 TRINITY_DN452_c1_g1~~TRINITY_DN452_c1_g1_i1.p1  ORF type:complete len:334 (-),score=35.47 TRINITY_DN452_c1_g1_i1:226-1227(-)
MSRRCSHCSNNGHNSRTCPSRGGGVKLFGVRLTDGLIKKSASMGNLSSLHYYNNTCTSSSPSSDPTLSIADGYASDDPTHASSSSNSRGDRKKGIPWTEDEHRMFLAGLQKLGKGDWRGIARNFVVSRTPTQVASHAQKYFIRQSNATRKKRRSSLFDMAPDMSIEPLPVLEEQLLLSPADETENLMKPSSTLQLSLDHDCNTMESTSNENHMESKETNFVPMVPAFLPTYLPVPLPFWPPNMEPTIGGSSRVETHRVLKPTPVLSKDPVNVDELVGMSDKLSLKDAVAGRIEPSPLSLKLLGIPSRQSAFHANPTGSGSDLSQSTINAIHAV